MSFGGETSVPSAIATLESIGNLGPQENKEIVRELTKFLEKEIKVKPDR